MAHSVILSFPDTITLATSVMDLNTWCSENCLDAYKFKLLDDREFQAELDREAALLDYNDPVAVSHHVAKIRSAPAMLEFKFADEESAALFRLKFG